MKQSILLFLLFMPALLYSQETPKTETRKSIEKANKTFYLITKTDKTKKAVVSTINFNVQQSYKDENLNKQIEKEIKNQWEELLKNGGYNTSGSFTYIHVNYFMVTGSLTTDQFVSMREKDINNLREKGYAVESKHFTYFPSSEIAGKLKEEKTILQSMTMIEDNRDRNKVQYGETVAEVVSVASTMMLLGADNTDEDNLLPWYIKANVGFGSQNTPMVINSIYTQNNNARDGESKIESENNLMIHTSFLFSLRNNKMISYRMQPFLNYGFYTNLISDNKEEGIHLNYGLSGAVGFGRLFKFLLKGEFAKRNGNINRTIEVPAYNSITEETGEYNYHTYKYGAGLYFDFGGHDSYFEMSAFRESPSLPHQGNVMSYELKLSFSFATICYQFGSEYPAGGLPKYWSEFNGGTSNYSNLYLSIPLTIAKKK